MVGGAPTYEAFIKFCVNNNPSEYTTSKIADKSIFIATTYNINEVKSAHSFFILENLIKQELFWYNKMATLW